MSVDLFSREKHCSDEEIGLMEQMAGSDRFVYTATYCSVHENFALW